MQLNLIYLQILISVLQLSLLVYIFLRPTAQKDEPDGNLTLNKPKSLKAWVKKEKKAPRVNDDSYAWRKEQQIE